MASILNRIRGNERSRIAAAEKTLDAKLITEDPGITDKTSKFVRVHRYSYSDLLDAIDKSIDEWRAQTGEYEQG